MQYNTRHGASYFVKGRLFCTIFGYWNYKIRGHHYDMKSTISQKISLNLKKF